MKIEIVLTDCTESEARFFLQTLGIENRLEIREPVSKVSKYVNQKDAAAICGLSAPAFARYAIIDGLCAKRDGKNVMYKRAEVERLKKKHAAEWRRNARRQKSDV